MQKTSKLQRFAWTVAVSMRSDPRIPTLEIHRNQDLYKNRGTTEQRLRQILEKKIIQGPFLYTPQFKTFANLYANVEDPFEEFSLIKECPSTSYMVLLGGVHDLFVIKEDEDDMSYIVRNIWFTEGGLGKSERNLQFVEKEGYLDEHFDALSKKESVMYEHLRRARKSYRTVAEEVGVSWMTVRNYYEKIMGKVKVLVAFFPDGYSSYNYLLMDFSTDYEIGIKEMLEQLPTTSYIFSLESLETGERELATVLFVYDVNLMTRFFKYLQKEKKIRNLKISIPARFYSP